MEDNVLGLSKTLSKVGGTLLISLGFVVLVVGLSSAGAPINNLVVLLGLVVLAIVLRLNLGRVDRKYDKEAEQRRLGRED